MLAAVTFDDIENPDAFMDKYLDTCPGKKKNTIAELSDEMNPQGSMERASITVPNYSPKRICRHQSYGWRGRRSNDRRKKLASRQRA